MNLFELVITNGVGLERGQMLLRCFIERVVANRTESRAAEYDGCVGWLVDRQVRVTLRVTEDQVHVMGTAETRPDDATVDAVRRRYEDQVADLFTLPVKPYGRRVFGVGCQRTGTRSLSSALRELGIFEIHYAGWIRDQVSRGDFTHPMFASFEGFTDNPFPSVFEALDHEFAGSLFVLTIRSTDSWIPSVRSLHERTKASPGWQWLYGRADFDEPTFRETYERHNAKVMEYFRSRPSDLLVLDLTKGHGFKELAAFLSLPDPGHPFPHRNNRKKTQANRAG